MSKYLKDMHKRPLAVITIFFILGIILARFLPVAVKFPHIFIVTLILIGISFILSRNGSSNEIASAPTAPRNDMVGNIFLLLSVPSFAALLYMNSNTFPNNHISHVLGEEKLRTDIVGVVHSPALTRRPYYGKINSTYLFEIEGVKDIGASGYRDIRGLAQIRIQTEKDYGYGDRLVVRGTIRKPFNSVIATPSEARGKQSHRKEIASSPSAPRNDRTGEEIASARQGGPRNDMAGKKRFNYREYLERQNIFALINTRENNATVLSHNYKSNPILRYTYLLREKFKNQIIEKMPLESGAFMRAILLGDRSELPKDIQKSFKNSGTMHILPTQCRGKYNYTPKSYFTLSNSIS